jgi:pimeloyl-ACP methyl ester carboxylesterase
MGGLFIRYYADLHPESVAGLVFLDTSHEDWFQFIRESWSAEDQQRYFEFWDDSNPEYTGVRREEKAAFEENFNMVIGSKIDEDMPVLVFTGGRHHHFRTDPQGLEEDRQKWIELHASLVEGVKNAKHIVHLEMNHWLHSQIPDEVAREMADLFEFENDAAQ